MIQNLTALWVLLALMTIGCKKEDTATQEIKSGSHLQNIPRMTWWMKSDVDFDISRDDVAKRLKNVFSKIDHTRLSIRKSRLMGEFAIAEKQGVLSLECRYSVNGIPFPVIAHIAATGPTPDLSGAEAMLQKGLEDVAQAADEMLHVVESEPALLTNYLTAAESDIQILAAKLIGLHKSKSAALALCALLKDPREEVAEAAAEALIAIDDPSSIQCVVNNISKKSLRSEVRAIEIMGNVGGAEAVAYLEMTSLGHELEEVRRLSKTLLKSLKTKQKEK